VAVLMVAVWLWGINLANPLVVAQAEAIQAEVVSPVSGRVVRLDAALYRNVSAGDVIAVVAASSPEVLSNTLAVIRAEMDAIRAGAGYRPGDRVRLAEFEMDWLNLRGELATLRADLQYARSELSRVEQLRQRAIADQSDLDVAQRDVQRLEEAVAEKARAVATAESALQGFNKSAAGGGSDWEQSDLHIAEERLRLAESELQPTVLRAPIDGQVTRLSVLAQSTVVRGQSLATVSEIRANRIVGYIPQPVRIEPRVGMVVEVRTRGASRQVVRSTVTDIGPRIELFDAPLRIRGMGAAQERGLPLIVSVPEHLRLRPGELVDLRIIED
jgi:multidrug resistance efflux pump